MNFALKILVGFFSLFLAAAVAYGLFLVGGWFFPVLWLIIAGADYFLIRNVFLKTNNDIDSNTDI